MRYARPDAMAHECRQEPPDSVQEMVASMNAMLKRVRDAQEKRSIQEGRGAFAAKCRQSSQSAGCKLLIIWWRCRIRTCDFHRVKLYVLLLFNNLRSADVPSVPLGNARERLLFPSCSHRKLDRQPHRHADELAAYLTLFGFGIALIADTSSTPQNTQ